MTDITNDTELTELLDHAVKITTNLIADANVVRSMLFCESDNKKFVAHMPGDRARWMSEIPKAKALFRNNKVQRYVQVSASLSAEAGDTEPKPCLLFLARNRDGEIICRAFSLMQKPKRGFRLTDAIDIPDFQIDETGPFQNLMDLEDATDGARH